MADRGETLEHRELALLQGAFDVVAPRLDPLPGAGAAHHRIDTGRDFIDLEGPVGQICEELSSWVAPSVTFIANGALL